MKDLTLVKRAPFGAMTVDYYGDGRGNFYMTREQIGRALGYSNPRAAIKDIHKRHKARLDPFSVIVKLSSIDSEPRGAQTAPTSGGIQETVLYSAKGVYEICRHSDMPVADAFYDAVYEVLEGLRMGYLSLKVEKASPLWQATRTGSKEARKAEGDTIARFVKYAQAQGSQNAERYYVNLSRLANEAAGITNRDEAHTSELALLQLSETVIDAALCEGMESGRHYKDIARAARERVYHLAAIPGLKGGRSA